MSIKFVKFVGNAAEFSESDGQGFRLNRHNLEIRITNLTEQAPHVDLSVEYAVLAEMKHREALERKERGDS